MTDKQIVPNFDKFSSVAVELNKIALGYTESLVELNLALMRKQSDLFLASWRDALAVKDMDGAKEYLNSQSEAARGVVEDYVADAKAVGELNKGVAEEVRKVVKKGISSAVKLAA